MTGDNMFEIKPNSAKTLITVFIVALVAIGYNLAPVPEPTSFVFFGFVAALAAVMARRRTKACR